MTDAQRQLKRKAELELMRYNFIRLWKRRHNSMLRRVEGRQTNKSHSEGKGIVSLEDFLAWCKSKDNLDEFLVLWSEWAEHDFKLWWAPSIDRIDSTKGYTIGNIQWMGFAENCKKNNRNPIDHSEEEW